jgi:hypothetical protein
MIAWKITTTCEGCKQVRSYYDTKALTGRQSLFCATCKSVQFHMTSSAPRAVGGNKDERGTAA